MYVQEPPLPKQSSLVRGIPELNSPRRIYDEWMCMCEEFSVPNIPPPKKFPSPEEIDQMFQMLSARAVEQITRGVDNSTLRTEIFTIAQTINGILDDYSTLPNLPVVTSNLKGPNSGQLQKAISNLETANANAIVILNQYTSHVEILADPRIGSKKYWNILTTLNSILFSFLARYVQTLRDLFRFVPYENVKKAGGGQEEITPVPRTPASPAVKASDAEARALMAELEELRAYVQLFTRQGYTWRAAPVNPGIIEYIRSRGSRIGKARPIIERMHDAYAELPAGSPLLSGIPQEQLESMMSSFRANINILKNLTDQFTLGKVFEVATALIKQGQALAREYGGAYEAMLKSCESVISPSPYSQPQPQPQGYPQNLGGYPQKTSGYAQNSGGYQQRYQQGSGGYPQSSSGGNYGQSPSAVGYLGAAYPQPSPNSTQPPAAAQFVQAPPSSYQKPTGPPPGYSQVPAPQPQPQQQWAGYPAAGSAGGYQQAPQALQQPRQHSAAPPDDENPYACLEEPPADYVQYFPIHGSQGPQQMVQPDLDPSYFNKQGGPPSYPMI